MDKEKREMLEMVKMGLMLATIIALIWTTITLVKNKDIIISDPLTYGMEVHGFVSCSCFDEDGKDWHSKDGGFIHEGYGEDWINYSGEDLSFNISELEGEKNRTG